MEWFIAVVVVAALGVAAIVAAGGLGSMSAEPTRDIFRQDLPTDRDLRGEDLQRLRFGVTLRGYAMDQVDDVIDRLSGELAERDQRIARLESTLAELGFTPPQPEQRRLEANPAAEDRATDPEERPSDPEDRPSDPDLDAPPPASATIPGAEPLR